MSELTSLDLITIHKLLPSEWMLYKKIQLEALKEEPQSFGSSYETWKKYSNEKWQERPSNLDSMIFIALHNNYPIGLLGVHLETEQGEQVAALWGMYVNLKFRGKGIGKRLVETAVSSIQHNKLIKKTTLMVNSEEHPAVKLYTKMGFTKVGTTDFVLGDGQKHLLYIMEKSI